MASSGEATGEARAVAGGDPGVEVPLELTQAETDLFALLLEFVKAEDLAVGGCLDRSCCFQDAVAFFASLRASRARRCVLRRAPSCGGLGERPPFEGRV